jgi:hypothetical protein
MKGNQIKTERMKKMGFNKDFFVDCVGAVTILTDDRIVFQGQLIKDNEERHHDDDDCCKEKCCPPPKVDVEVKAKLDDDPDFIVVRLTCDPAIIRDNASIQEIDPDLFEEGDIIRINVNEIIAVGPSNGCLDDPPAKS